MKKLLIQAANNYTDGFSVVAINSLHPVKIEGEFGTFELSVCIKNFQGSSYHDESSLYNIDGTVNLDQKETSDDEVEDSMTGSPAMLSFDVKFCPARDISGDELLFGNDCCYSIKKHVPTASLNAGLKLFNWFVNNTVRGNLDDDKPFLYGPMIGAATYLAPLSTQDQFPNEISKIDTSKADLPEQLLPEFPSSKQRKKYFNKVTNCKNFTYKQANHYQMKVDSNFISMSDCKYAINLPTFTSKRFVVDVGKHISEHFDNFNWVIKVNGQDSVDEGSVGLVVNFKVIEE